MPYKDKDKKKEYDKLFYKEWYKKNKHKVDELKRLWRLANPEKTKEYIKRAKVWKEKNIEKVRKYQRIASKKWQKKHPEIGLKKYSMTESDYQKMLKEQGGVCAICGKIDERRLSVDHCHITKRNRGLLCRTCNIALGMFKDSPSLLRKAILYLK